MQTETTDQRLNPFINQVNLVNNNIRINRYADEPLSQSLHKSGQFGHTEKVRESMLQKSLNPFINQVNLVQDKLQQQLLEHKSQSLHKSGQFGPTSHDASTCGLHVSQSLHKSGQFGREVLWGNPLTTISLNPFINQVNLVGNPANIASGRKSVSIPS